VDTTVIEANVAYPTDRGLLGKGFAALCRLVMVLRVAGLARSTTFGDRGRSVRRRAHEVAVWLRRRNDDARDEVLALTGQLADLAELTISEAVHVALNARRTLRRRAAPGSARSAQTLAEIDRVAALLEQIVAQSRLRLACAIPDGAKRIVSLHDPDARPIRKGRLGRPVEFRFRAQVAHNLDGIVLDTGSLSATRPTRPCSSRLVRRSRPASGEPQDGHCR
jgi:IS5 family transposase